MSTEIEKTMDDKPQLTCSICGNPILADANGWTGGHNAEPINDGRCCGDCNTHKVVPERLRRLYERKGY